MKDDYTYTIVKYEYNCIGRDGMCNPSWFTEIAKSMEGRSIVVRKCNGYTEYNYVGDNGKCISEEWFVNAHPFKDGLGKVRRKEDGLWNFIDRDGNMLFPEWFNSIINFKDGIAIVQRSNNKWYYIDKRGVDLFDEGFVRAEQFYDGYAIVTTIDGDDVDTVMIDKEGNKYNKLKANDIR